MPNRPPAPFAILFCAIALLAGISASAQTPTPATTPTQASTPLPTKEEAIQRIDAAVHARTEAIAGYSVEEHYAIFRNGEQHPSAEVTVKTVYDRATGKEYTPIAQSGSDLLRSIVIDKVIANEKEMAKAANRESVSVTSANYDMEPEPAPATLNNHDCLIMDLRARRKATYLFNGKAWFDLADFTLLHLEGSPAQSVSFMAGDTTGTRDYEKIQGFSMATRANVHSHSFLMGTTVMTIDYTNYQIQLDKAPAPTPAPPQ